VVAARPGRLPALDGLRGVAALVVLVHHSLLTIPALALAYYPEAGTVAPGTPAWIVTNTPLHVLWAGTEAVYLFFLLSGFVLTLPLLRAHRFPWRTYYPRRIVRLYGPVVCAILLGALLLLVVHRPAGDALGAWVAHRPSEYRPTAVLRDLVLVFGVSGVISPLWSLSWEVLFSFLLPLYWWGARHARRVWWIALAALFALIAAGSVLGNDFLVFLPMFAIGSLLARRVDDFRPVLGGRVAQRWWPVALILAVVLVSARWEATGLGAPVAVAGRLQVVAVAGVAVLLAAAIYHRPLGRLLEGRLPRFLGLISFSLYLVHEPIVIAARVVGGRAPLVVTILLGIAASIAVGWLFARFVEAPFHRLAKRLGGRPSGVQAPA
jgi:peptidoglycan/LPS O-acetylase OafA/YrhL